MKLLEGRTAVITGSSRGLGFAIARALAEQGASVVLAARTEEMLRMMRKCREKGNFDCEIIMNEFMGKDFKKTDYERFKKQFFGKTSKKRNSDEKNKDIQYSWR